MATIPTGVKHQSIIPSLKGDLSGQGKTRDIYEVPGSPDKLLIVASDRVSIFDFVLPALVPRKGEVLTALTHFWFTNVLTGINNHLAQEAGGSRNQVHGLKDAFIDVQLERSLLVRKLKILPFELIFRAHLGGSVWREYEKDGTVAGITMPTGLVRWQQLAEPIFTPSTKSADGHDKNITQAEYFEKTGQAGKEAAKLAFLAYSKAYSYAIRKGIRILDSKFEVGFDENGQAFLADEVLTPDSSRFVLSDDLIAALKEKCEPPFHDKEPVRQWGRGVSTPFPSLVGINSLDTDSEEHREFVGSVCVPDIVIRNCSDRYLDILNRITGSTLNVYRLEKMM